MSSAAGGFFGSLGASGFGAIAGNWSGTAGGQIFFGALSGGIGAELTGGNFWQGAVTGGIVAGLNHVAHNGIHMKKPEASNGDDPPKVIKTKLIKSKEYSNSLKGSRGGAIAIIENIKEGPKLGQGPGTFVPSASHSEVNAGMTFYDNNMVDVNMVISADRINTTGSYIVNYSVESSGKIVSSGILLDKGLGISRRIDFPVITRPGVNILSTVGGIRVPVNSILKVNIGLLGKYPAGGVSSISTRHVINIK